MKIKIKNIFYLLLVAGMVYVWMHTYNEDYTMRGNLIGKVTTQNRDGNTVYYHQTWQMEDGTCETHTVSDREYFGSSIGKTYIFKKSKLVWK